MQLPQFCIENATVGIFRLADDARILEANKHACESLGYSRKELMGMRLFDIDPTFSFGKWVTLQNYIAEHRVQIIRAHHRRKNGVRFPVEVIVNYIESEGRGFTYFFAIDLLHRNEAERKREELQTRLRQGQKMEAIGTLASGIAHDFNNILSVIIGNANLLEMSKEIIKEDMQCVQQILIASDRAKQLVYQILTFSRQGEQHRMVVNLKPVIKETISFLKTTFPNIVVRLRTQTINRAVLADPIQIQQVLMNLCTNSAHAMQNIEAGKIEISMENFFLTKEEAHYETEVESGEFIKLTVTDTGPGIDPWIRRRMFEPYFTTKARGTGLGLSVVHGIVKAHGGYIKVYSEPGNGTSFYVFLPAISEGTKSELAPADISLPIGSESLLLVDDEIAVAEVTKHMLEQLGYHVTIRTSPIEAIEAFRASQTQYAAVITDMTMPQMNGVVLAKKLLEIQPELPILLCSGFSDRGDEAKAGASGISAFAYKPLALRDFATTLRKMLDAKDANSMTG